MMAPGDFLQRDVMQVCRTGSRPEEAAGIFAILNTMPITSFSSMLVPEPGGRDETLSCERTAPDSRCAG
jgi:hypothetical protein